MYKHLVVAVDGSETSANALKHACSVAAAGKARLTLVHVANPAEYMALAPEFLQQDSYEEAAIANGNEVLSAALEITNGAEAGIARLARPAFRLFAVSGHQGPVVARLGLFARRGRAALLPGGRGDCGLLGGRVGVVGMLLSAKHPLRLADAGAFGRFHGLTWAL